jgi:hypothetical protein
LQNFEYNNCPSSIAAELANHATRSLMERERESTLWHYLIKTCIAIHPASPKYAHYVLKAYQRVQNDSKGTLSSELHNIYCLIHKQLLDGGLT